MHAFGTFVIALFLGCLAVATLGVIALFVFFIIPFILAGCVIAGIGWMIYGVCRSLHDTN